MSSQSMQAEPGSRRLGAGAAGPSLATVWVVWGLFGALLVTMFITYARFPAAELYHVSGTGLMGGGSRVLVALNFPVAIVAAVMMPVVAARLLAAPLSPGRKRAVASVTVIAAGLCGVAAWPGVVRQADLDAKAINAVPAVGVGLAVGLTAMASVRGGPGSALRWPSSRRVLALAAGLLLVMSLPWLFAEAGFYINDAPGLGSVFLSEQFKPATASLPVVHVGHHHGLDGVLFAASAILLIPALGAIASRGLRHVATAAVALLFVYGVGNAVEDFWGEQVVKRGWTDEHIPQVLRPEFTPAWGAIVVVAVLLWAHLERDMAREGTA